MSENLPPREAGRAAAEKEWATERVVYLNYGDVHSSVPVIHPTGFYFAVSWDDGEYIRAYNARVEELLRVHGLPEWSPGRRVVKENELTALLAKSQPFSTYTAASDSERRLVKRHTRLWRDDGSAEPTCCFRLEERKALVLLGRVGSKTRIDVLDLKDGVWMARYELESDVVWTP